MLKKIKKSKKQDMILMLVDEIEIYSRETSEKRHRDLKEDGYTDEQIKSIEAEAWAWIMEAVRELGNK